MHDHPIVVFPRRLLATISSTIARHDDDREFGLNLFGILHARAGRSLVIPLLALGTGLERVRRAASCAVDASLKRDLVAALEAQYEWTPRCTWTELGNIHRHPGAHAVPSPGGDTRSAAAFLRDLPANPFFVIGIVHRRDGPSLSTYAVDRHERVQPIPWTCLDLPTLADPGNTFGFEWLSAPLTIMNRVRWLASRGCAMRHRFDAAGGVTLTAEQGSIRAEFRLAPRRDHD